MIKITRNIVGAALSRRGLSRPFIVLCAALLISVRNRTGVRIAAALALALGATACEEMPGGAGMPDSPPADDRPNIAPDTTEFCGTAAAETGDPRTLRYLNAEHEGGIVWRLVHASEDVISVYLPSGCNAHIIVSDYRPDPAGNLRIVLDGAGDGQIAVDAQIERADQELDIRRRGSGDGDALVLVSYPDGERSTAAVVVARLDRGAGDAQLTLASGLVGAAVERNGDGDGDAVCGTESARLGCRVTRSGDGDGDALIQGAGDGWARQGYTFDQNGGGRVSHGKGTAWCATSGDCHASVFTPDGWHTVACTGYYLEQSFYNCPPDNPAFP